MKNKIKKLVAFVLCITMVFTAIPVVASAKDVSTIATTPQTDASAEPYIVCEIVEKREKDTKHFLMSDGSIVACVYPQAVHYEEDGEFKSIDNSLETTVDNSGKTVYKNKANAFSVNLPESLNDGYVEYSDANGFIHFKMVGVSNKKLEKKTKYNSSKNDEMTADKVTGSVSYKSIKKNIDLEYDITGDSLKETIVLHKKTKDSFVFELKTSASDVIKLDDGSIEFYDENQQVVYTIASPYMFDSAGEYSDSIEVIVNKTTNGYFVEYIPNYEWLSDKSREYPVKIDPTVQTVQSASAIKDTSGILAYRTDELQSLMEDNYSYLYLKVGRFYDTSVFSLIYVPIPENISDSCRIINATMNLFCYKGGISTCSTDMTIVAREITEDWNQNTITTNQILYYADLPEFDTDRVIDYITVNDTSVDIDGKLYSFDITKMAQKWSTGENVNRGILLQGVNLPPTENYMRFYDSDNVVAGSDPFFTYTYREVKGIEDYWTYTSVEAGRSGTAAVNNFNGNLMMTQNITGIAGNRMPVSISLVYDSSSRAENLYNVGYGWRINYNMSISTSDLTGYPYYLTDSDGTKHYFTGQTTDSEWKDEDGLGYALKKDSTVYTNGYLIVDKAKQKIYFRSDGKIGRIQDTFGNQVNVTYDSYNRIQSISDGANRIYSFAYTDDKISSITNPADKTVTFGYTAGDLTSITYPDLKSTTFEYGTNGISKVTSPDGTYTKFSYNLASNHLYTSSLEYYGSNNVLNTDYDFTYKHNSTVVTSDCDNTINHNLQFDDFGKTIGVVNGDLGAAEYYQYGAPGGIDGTANKLISASKTLRPAISYYTDSDFSDTTKYYVNTEFGTDTEISVDSTKGRSNAPSLKIQNTGTEQLPTQIVYDLGALTNGYEYTASLYVNMPNTVLSEIAGISMFAYYYDENGEMCYLQSSSLVATTEEDEWQQISLNFSVTNGEHIYLMINGYITPGKPYWIDDLQIYVGECSEYFNSINNSMFFKGSEDWQYKINDVNSTDSSGSATVGASFTIMGSLSQKRSCSQVTDCSGKAGDVLCFGGRGVGYSVPTGVTKSGSSGETTFRLRIELTGPSGTATFTNDSNVLDFNYALEEWQFVSGHIIAPIDFTSATLYFDFDYNIGFGMFSQAFIYKEPYGQSYTYDSNGNVVSTTSLSDTEATFAYQNNNLSQMINPTGSRYSYAYNEETNALEYASVSSGQLYEFTYDQYGNITASNLRALANATSITNNGVYYIRNVTTGNAMKSLGTASGAELVNGSYANQNTTVQWKLVSAGETDVYYIQSMEVVGCNLAVKDASSEDKAKIIITTAADTDAQKFKLVSNGDGSFRVLSKVSNYQKSIDVRALNDNNSTELNKTMCQNTYDSTVGYQKWYFTPYAADLASQLSINTVATYTSDGNYTSTVTDALGNTLSYVYNENGTIDKIVDAKQVETRYTYDENSGDLTLVSSDGSTNSYTYENDQIKTIETPNGTVYTFIYDAFGRNTSIQVNRKNSTATARTLVTYQYNDELDITYDTANGSKNNLANIVYGNDYVHMMRYDQYGRMNQDGIGMYEYNVFGNMTAKYSYDWNSTKTEYKYDFANRVTNALVISQYWESPLYSVKYKYVDKKDLLDSYSFMDYNQKLTTSYVYGDINSGEIADAIYGVKLDGNLKIGYNYDDLARITNRTLYTGSATIDRSQVYKAASGNTTSCVVESLTENGHTYNYTYDANGNITGYTRTKNSTNEVVESYIYQYDNKNQLVFAGTSATNGTRYNYDANGNITSKVNISNNKTVNYVYNDPTWTDLLTSYNGQIITYDAIGNPLQYRGGMTFTWVEGRKLETVTMGDVTYTYAYDSDGNRIAKQYMLDDGENFAVADTSYFIVDGVLYGETRNDVDGNITTIYYLYDDNGQKYGLVCNDVYYYYQYNLQGDVVGIYNANGQIVVEYTYDAWGKVSSVTGTLASTIGQLNSIRYRGYYYDAETGLYYVSSRYYDPEIGRWINADSQLNTSLGILGLNQFSYCLNNPVNMVDYGGNKPGDLFDTMDEAARDFAEYINAKSIEDNREYASYIYTKTVTETRTTTYINPNILGNNPLSWLWNVIFGGGLTKTVTTKVKVTKYTYREPKRGTVDSSSPPINWFGIHTVVGRLHTHAAYDPAYANDIFSPADKRNAERQGVPTYVATPLGTLRKYDPSNGTDIVLFNDIPFDPNHPGR